MNTSFFNTKNNNLELCTWVFEDGQKQEEANTNRKTETPQQIVWPTQVPPTIHTVPKHSRPVPLEPQWKPSEPVYQFPLRF
mgnify:CR=1 FL=1